jgi:hypothetical protein
VVGDVLKENESWLYLADDAGDVGPEVAGVVRAESLPGHAERLAGVAANEAIHDATPRSAVEGGKIAPQRARIQAALFHARDKEAGDVGFSLNATDDASSWMRQSNGEIESAVAGAEGEDVEPGTYSHIGLLLHERSPCCPRVALRACLRWHAAQRRSPSLPLHASVAASRTGQSAHW